MKRHPETDKLERRLLSLGAKIRRQPINKTLIAMATNGLFGLLALFLVDYLTNIPYAVRVLVWASALIYAIVYFVRVPLKRAKEPYTAEDISLVVEDHNPELRSGMISALQFQAAGDVGPGMSAGLVQASINRSFEDIKKAKYSGVVPTGWMKKFFPLFFLSLALVAGTAVLTGNYFIAFAKRLVIPGVSYPTKTKIVSVNLPDMIASEDPFDIEVKVEGEYPQLGKVVIETGEGHETEMDLAPKNRGRVDNSPQERVIPAKAKEPTGADEARASAPSDADTAPTPDAANADRNTEVADNESQTDTDAAAPEAQPAAAVTARVKSPSGPKDGLFICKMPPLMDKATVTIFIGDAQYGPVDVTPVPRPRIAEFKLTVTPPAYTKKAPSTIQSGNARVHAGSTLGFAIKPSKPLKTLTLVSSKGDALPTLKPADDGYWRVEFQPKDGLNYSLAFEDKQGLKSRNMPSYRVGIIPDRPPRVQLILPNATTEIAPISKLPLRFKVKDDFQVKKVTVRYHVETPETQELGEEVVKQEIEGKIYETFPQVSQSRFNFDGIWDNQKIGVQPSQVIRMWVEAEDNNEPEPHKVKSSEVILPIITMEEYKTLLHKRLSDGMEGVEEIIIDLKGGKRTLDKLQQK